MHWQLLLFIGVCFELLSWHVPANKSGTCLIIGMIWVVGGLVGRIVKDNA